MKTALILLVLAVVVTFVPWTPPVASSTALVSAAKPTTPGRDAKAPSLTVTPVGDLVPLLGDATPGPVLFRRPVPPAELLAQQQAKTALAYDLSGVSGKGDSWTAFFRQKESGQMIVARVGQPLGAWRVEAIDGACVVVRRGTRTQRLCV